MEPKSFFLKFYEDKKQEFDDLTFLDSVYEDHFEFQKRLQDAKKFPSLKRLCGGNERVMFGLLQVFMTLESAKKLDSLSNQPRNQKDWKRKQKSNLNKTIKESYKKLLLVTRRIAPEVDEQALLDRWAKWIKTREGGFRFGLDKYYDAVDFVCTLDPKLNHGQLTKKVDSIIPKKREKNNLNNHLRNIFQLCSDKTDLSPNAIYENMAAVLNSLKITSKTGKPFSRSNLKKAIESADSQ